MDVDVDVDVAKYPLREDAAGSTTVLGITKKGNHRPGWGFGREGPGSMSISLFQVSDIGVAFLVWFSNIRGGLGMDSRDVWVAWRSLIEEY